MTPKIIALVPMKHTSERVPKKNYRDFGGKSLFFHILETLREVPEIDKTVVNTDSPLISELLTQNFPEVEVIIRPDHLCGGEVPMNDILLYDVTQFEADFYLQTHSTNPLLKAETIRRAIHAFLSEFPTRDSLFSVTRQYTRFWNALIQPVNHNPNILLRTQDLPPIYEENSNIYIFSGETLQKKYNRIGDRPLIFEIDQHEAWDIDNEIDFKIAEFLYLSEIEETQ